MREDQHKKFQELSEKLGDVALEELDPDNWPGKNTPIDKQDSKIRGDRYWHKKNGVATVSLIMRINSLVDVVRKNSQQGTGAAAIADDEAELDKDINATEKEAAKLIKELQSKDSRGRYEKSKNV